MTSVLDAIEIVAPTAARNQIPSQEELEQYDGHWVAVSEGRVLGFGRSPRTALRRAQSAMRRAASNGDTELIFFKVPLRPEGRAYY